jgi:hypothetical protein
MLAQSVIIRLIRQTYGPKTGVDEAVIPLSEQLIWTRNQLYGRAKEESEFCVYPHELFG